MMGKEREPAPLASQGATAATPTDNVSETGASDSTLYPRPNEVLLTHRLSPPIGGPSLPTLWTVPSYNQEALVTLYRALQAQALQQANGVWTPIPTDHRKWLPTGSTIDDSAY